MTKTKPQAINLNDSFSKNSDMTTREHEMLSEITRLTGFAPEKNVWRSQYWGKNLGASHWLGNLDGKPIVLKIQGVKPDISEIFMIQEFAKHNKSDLIRPPKVYKSISWSDDRAYEAIFMESVTGSKVLDDRKIQTKDNISEFFKYYAEYRKNCIPTKPWLSKLSKKNWASESFERLTSASIKAYSNHPFRNASDFAIAKNAYEILERFYKNVDLEFLHGHFSCNDLKYESPGSDKAVLFSNLFWKWRFPFFDAVFAYHWFMYELSHVKDITEAKVEEQRKIWHEEIFKAVGAKKSSKIKFLVQAVLLERAVAGLIVDSFLVDPNKPIAKYLTDTTRSEVNRLTVLLAK